MTASSTSYYVEVRNQIRLWSFIAMWAKRAARRDTEPRGPLLDRSIVRPERPRESERLTTGAANKPFLRGFCVPSGNTNAASARDCPRPGATYRRERPPCSFLHSRGFNIRLVLGAMQERCATSRRLTNRKCCQLSFR